MLVSFSGIKKPSRELCLKYGTRLLSKAIVTLSVIDNVDGASVPSYDSSRIFISWC